MTRRLALLISGALTAFLLVLGAGLTGWSQAPGTDEAAAGAVAGVPADQPRQSDQRRGEDRGPARGNVSAPAPTRSALAEVPAAPDRRSREAARARGDSAERSEARERERHAAVGDERSAANANGSPGDARPERPGRAGDHDD